MKVTVCTRTPGDIEGMVGWCSTCVVIPITIVFIVGGWMCGGGDGGCGGGGVCVCVGGMSILRI